MIHWAWLLPTAMISGTAGFMLCALLVMAKQSDEALEEMKPQGLRMCNECGELLLNTEVDRCHTCSYG